jgi:iron complex transport system substrate-binding protein
MKPFANSHGGATARPPAGPSITRRAGLVAAAFALVALAFAPSAALAAKTVYPMTIKNGDRTLTFDKAPTRAVSINTNATENMLALGLGDRMVGTGYQNYPVPAQWKAAYDKIPKVSPDNAPPSLEALLGAKPDFVYARMSAYTEKTTATLDRLAEVGLKAMAVQGTMKNGATMEDVYADIRNLGIIFDVQDRAEEVIKGMQDKLAGIQAKVKTIGGKPLEVLVYDSGTDNNYTAGTALMTQLIALAGGRNVFDDLDTTWANVTWEKAVSRSPEFIVITDYGTVTAEQKVNFLTTNPALSSMPAVKNKRFVVVPLPGIFESTRAVDQVEVMAKAFYPTVKW